MNYCKSLNSISAALFIAVLTLSACASPPQPPSLQLQAAEMAIKNAELDVTDHPSPELAEARQKLAVARTAVENKDMIMAARLADESWVNAELATAKADAAKANAINNELQQGVESLNQELHRSERVQRSQDIQRNQNLQPSQEIKSKQNVHNSGAY